MYFSFPRCIVNLKSCFQEKYISEENIEFGLEHIWTMNLDYVTLYWIWTGNLLDNDYALLALDFKILDYELDYDY